MQLELSQEHEEIIERVLTAVIVGVVATLTTLAVREIMEYMKGKHAGM